MPKELHLKGQQFNIATMILFIPFILFEIPENIILKKTKPYIWLTILIVGCGEWTSLAYTTMSADV